MSLYYYHFSYHVASDWHIDEVYMFRSMANEISFVFCISWRWMLLTMSLNHHHIHKVNFLLFGFFLVLPLLRPTNNNNANQSPNIVPPLRTQSRTILAKNLFSSFLFILIWPPLFRIFGKDLRLEAHSWSLIHFGESSHMIHGLKTCQVLISLIDPNDFRTKHRTFINQPFSINPMIANSAFSIAYLFNLRN